MLYGWFLTSISTWMSSREGEMYYSTRCYKSTSPPVVAVTALMVLHALLHHNYYRKIPDTSVALCTSDISVPHVSYTPTAKSLEPRSTWYASMHHVQNSRSPPTAWVTRWQHPISFNPSHQKYRDIQEFLLLLASILDISHQG